MTASQRRHRSYLALRRSCLTLVIAALVGVPLWHLARAIHDSAGVAAGEGWDGLAAGSTLAQRAPSLLGTPWSLAVAGVEFLDPLAGASLLASGGAGAGILVALLPTVLLVAVLGRFFCGWLCPYLPLLAAANGIRALLTKSGVRLPDVRLDRATPFVVLAVLLVLSAVGGTVIATWVYPPAIIGRELLRAVFFGSVGAGTLFVLLALAFDAFVSRGGFCTYLCPGGALFRVIGVGSPIRVRRDPQACTGCGDCDAVCGLDQSPMSDDLDTGCERCGKCVASCPEDALRLAWGRPAGVLARRGARS